MVVVLPVGTADQRGRDACNGLHLVVARRHIRHDLVGGEAVVVVVVVGVVHHLHARVSQGLHGLRVLIHPVPYQEEGGLHIVLAENVDEHLGVLVAPGGVKGDGAELLALLGRALHAVNGELPGRPRRRDRRRDMHRPKNRCRRQHRPHSQSGAPPNQNHPYSLTRHKTATFLFCYCMRRGPVCMSAELGGDFCCALGAKKTSFLVLRPLVVFLAVS